MIVPPIVKDKYTVFPFLVSGALLVTAFSLAYIHLAEIQSLLIVHFDSFRGIDFLGDKNDVYGMVGVGAIALLINSALANIFYFRERFLSYLLAFGTLVLTFLLLIAVFAILSIN